MLKRRERGSKMEKLAITVSGGRSSAYVAWFFYTYLREAFDLTFVFANTGFEHEETLLFVKQLEINFNIPIVWVEAKVQHGKKKSSTYKIVDFDSASRNGEPFEEMVKKYGLPNSSYPHCTRELKICPLKSYMKERGIKVRTLGIRADEPQRYKPDSHKIYPMIEWMYVTKEDVLAFWEKQTFNLNIPEHLGNCLTCFRKSDRKLKTIAVEHPSFFDFPKMLEDKYGHMTTNGRPRKMFRGQLSSSEILQLARGEFVPFVDPSWGQNTEEVCAEECGTVEVDYQYDSGGINGEEHC
jgi:hypothetical protein